MWLKKTTTFELGVDMATLKDWEEEEYKNRDRSSHKLLSMGLSLRFERTKTRLSMSHFRVWSMEER